MLSNKEQITRYILLKIASENYSKNPIYKGRNKNDIQGIFLPPKYLLISKGLLLTKNLILAEENVKIKDLQIPLQEPIIVH